MKGSNHQVTKIKGF